MNDHNLDDLIIDNMEPKNNKAKSFLTIIALIIVALIVGILFIKTMQSDPQKSSIGLEENMSDLISPELTLQSEPKVKAPEDDTRLSSMIEEKLTAPQQQKKEEEIVKETIEINEEVTAPKSAPVTSVPTVPQTPAPTAAKSLPEETPAPAETVTAAKPESRPATTEAVVVPKKSYRKETAKAPAAATHKPTSPTVSGRYYIQVGSFAQAPSTRFLNTIKKHGFSYKITAPTANGTKKLLIGPYGSREAADNALVRVKDRINKGAFIVKR